MEIKLLLLFMICASIMAVGMKDLISSVIALSAVGLGVCFAFLILKAPNLAITQLVVEILCVIILIRATIKKDLPLIKDGRWLFNTVATLLFIACFLFFIYFALKELPAFGQPLMFASADLLRDGLTKYGSINLVNAITSNLRSYDALGELAVLFGAMVAVLAISRKKGRSDDK